MSDRDLEAAELAAEETKCEIDLETTKQESTWYSIINVLALSMGSGMGIPFSEDDTNEAFGDVGICISDLANPLPLKAIYKSGDPHLTGNYSDSDFQSWSWSDDSFDRTLVPQAQSWSIIAETECAKLFGIQQESWPTSPDTRKDWLSYSLAVAAEARKQCDFAFDKLRNAQGLFVPSSAEGSVGTDSGNLEDQVSMLWAAVDVGHLAARSGVFENVDIRDRMHRFSDRLFEIISDNKSMLLDNSVNRIQAQSIAVPALSWYASVTRAQDLRARALWLLRELADNLVNAQDANEMVGSTLVDAASALRALTEAFRVTGLRTYAESAAKIFDYMESQWWKLPGVYAQTPLSTEYTYNADDVAVILGGLNAARLFLGERINRSLAELRIRLFFCKAVNRSGLQMSMPSAELLSMWLGIQKPASDFRYRTIPLPNAAGGEFGIAPVFAGEISYDPQGDVWSRNVLFDTQAAMRASCEFFWINDQAVNGFPKLMLDQAPLEVKKAAGM